MITSLKLKSETPKPTFKDVQIGQLFELAGSVLVRTELQSDENDEHVTNAVCLYASNSTGHEAGYFECLKDDEEINRALGDCVLGEI